MMLFFKLHILVSLLITRYFMRQENMSRLPLVVFLISVCFPVGGLIIIYVFFLVPVKQSGTIADTIGLSNDQTLYDANLFKRSLDIKHEVDVAPLEDVLLLAEFSKRRQTVLKLLKKDVVQYSNYLNLALHNDDSETAHYAASGILQAKRRLDKSIQTYSRFYALDPDDAVKATSYADLIQQYLGLTGLDLLTEANTRRNAIPVLENIVNNGMSDDEKYLIFLIDDLIACGMFDKASVYCQKLLDESPDTEDKFIVLLKSFYIIKDMDKFKLVFNNMLDSNIDFSDEAMNVVRFWMKAITYEYD